MELLLGGKSSPEVVTPRNLTEIEWSLLEEIVRVMVRPLGEDVAGCSRLSNSKWNRWSASPGCWSRAIRTRREILP